MAPSKHRGLVALLCMRGCTPAAQGLIRTAAAGFVTSALQLWSGEDCAKKFFRRGAALHSLH